MGMRKMAEGVEKRPYFEGNAGVTVPQCDEGTREMGELYPFVVSGGRNTERYYFMHVSNVTPFKFNVRPKYFGDESDYTYVFPLKIREILERNNDAKVFCVFDWDTIYGDRDKEEKHEGFKALFREEMENGTVRAENNIMKAEAEGALPAQSYSYVYPAFKSCPVNAFETNG